MTAVRGAGPFIMMLAGLLASSAVLANKHPWEDYDKRLEGSRSPAALGSDVFGDSVNLQDGSLSFSVTDVSLPGNNALPVAFGRSYRVFNRKDYGDLGVLADWELELPRISATTATEWLSSSGGGNRCSDTNGTQAAPTGFQKQDYFQGLQLQIPGVGGGELLVRNATTDAPTDGKTYPWMTEGQIHVSCLTTIGNRTGQGFLAVTPDGTRYYFDWMAQEALPVLEAADFNYSGRATTYLLVPRKTSLYVRKVVDRHGNWVQYTYGNAWNQPAQLNTITSSDGRTITVGYSGGLVSSVSNGSNSWQYEYGTTTSGRATLTDVILPDDSRWEIEFADMTNEEILTTEAHQMDPREEYRSCKRNETPLNLTADQDPANDQAIGSVTHPGGATGTFTMDILQHGLSNVPVSCGNFGDGDTSWFQGNNPNDDKNLFAMKYYAFTLTGKSITGPGLPDPSTQPGEALVWQYSYSPNLSWFWAGNATMSYPVCTSGVACYERKVCDGGPCEGASITTVTGPNGEWERYAFGNSFRYNEGKLLTVHRGSGATDVLETSVNTYDLSLVDQVYPASFGDSQRGNDAFAAMYHRPLVKRAITRQGETFTWQIESCNGKYCTDEQVHPEKVRRHSTLGFSRTETTNYWNDFGKWIIGLPETVKCMQAAPVDDACNGDIVSETAFDPTTALPTTTKQFGKLQHTLSHYADGTLKTYKDGNNNVTTLSGWHRGVPELIAYPGAVSVSATVNPTGTIASTTDENGHKTCYDYDDMGRLTEITYPSESQAGVCDTSAWNLTTASFGKLLSAENGVGAGHWRHQVSTGTGHKLVYFDALWRPMLTLEHDSAVSGTARWVRTEHDHAGRNTFTSYPSASSTVATGTRSFHDEIGRVVKVEQDSDLGILTTTTDYPLTAFQVSVTNPRLFTTTTTAFQGWDQPTYDLPLAITHPEGAYTNFDRDPYGKPTELNRSGGTVSVSRSYDYNDYQELCRQVEPETGVTVMGYDAAGNLAWSAGGLTTAITCSASPTHADIVARKAVRTYDARNRLLTLTFPDGLSDQVWTYTPDGLPATITTYNNYNHLANRLGVITAYAYNARRMLAGQGESVHQENSYTWGFGYGYDRNGHLAANTYPSGLAVNYVPNALGQPTKVGTYATGVSYHPNGEIAHFTYGNGIVRTVEQTIRGLPHRIRDAKPATSDVFDDFHDYDPNGNVIALTDGASGRGQRGNRDMTYDGLDRLATVDWPTLGTSAGYAYDALDNLTEVHVQSPGSAYDRDHFYCYDGSNRLTNVKTTGCTTGSTVIGLGYDLQGNVNNKDGVEYHFDYANRLRQVGQDLDTSSEAIIETYRYDGLGRRVQARSATGARVLSQYSRGGQLVYQYDYRTSERIDYLYLGSQLVATRTRPVTQAVYTTEYQHTDALGSPVVATNAAGTRLRYDEYEAYGLRTNRLNDDRPGHTGHVMDAATGLTYMQQRYYDPGIGMFLSVDPITAEPKSGGNFNRYWYANNNPYTNRDPDGRICVIAFGMTTEMCARSLRYQALDSDGDIRSRTRFFGAASVVTNALAPTLGSPFLTQLSRDLEAANLGRLQGMRSGVIPTSRSTRENDYAFVHFEQSVVQNHLDQLKSDSPAIYSSFVGTVNGILNGVGPRGGDPNFAKAVGLAKKEVGGSLDFGNQDHREALGKAMTDVVRSSQNFCTGSRIRTC